MSCKKCKKNKQVTEQNLTTVEKVIKGFFIVWSLFAIYGIYTLITQFF